MPLTAQAEMRFSIAPAVRYASVAEYDQNDRRTVKESGWLPGLVASLDYEQDRFGLFAQARAFSGTLDYDGQLQNGTRFATDTETDLAQAQLGIRYRVLPTTSAYIAGGYDLWKRDIRGDGRAVGLRERTSSRRLVLGMEQQWQLAGGTVTAGASVVRARPEHLQVRFAGLLDEVSLRTKAATGYGLALAYQPAGFPHLSFGADIDYMKIGRSDAYPVTSNGSPAGLITQPEHVRRGATLYLAYRF